ncbi:MAG: hypothetical protein HKN20_06070 [Gemmatimonadetes bacterium]|nr:hypothetical protein [Gemmatimonadota bacterium]
MQDPDPYLESLDLSVRCAVNPRMPARMDAGHRTRVNHEIFYFATEREREKFATKPLEYVGVVTDPVTMQRFEPNSLSPRRDHDGIPFYFLSEGNRDLFTATPDSFVVPKLRMKS